MNLYHLRYFSTLAHIEHYTKAADILAITQPSLSYAISTLEEELGVKLFEKNGRNVTLTKYGKVFLKDVEEVLNLLRQRKDFKIVQERDYINHQKESGYRSYHVIIEYPVEMVDGRKNILAEIQIRTLAMNFWATIEHSLNYKYQGAFPDELRKRLAVTAKIAYALDEEMSTIREEIQEAQLLFNPSRHKVDDGVENRDDFDEEHNW